MQIGKLTPVLQRNIFGLIYPLYYFLLDQKVIKKSRLRVLPDNAAFIPLKNLRSHNLFLENRIDETDF